MKNQLICDHTNMGFSIKKYRPPRAQAAGEERRKEYVKNIHIALSYTFTTICQPPSFGLFSAAEDAFTCGEKCAMLICI